MITRVETYPYKPFEGGIDFLQLLQRAEHEPEGFYESASGRRLWYQAGIANLDIVDSSEKKYKLKSRIASDGSVAFNLRTKLALDDPQSSSGRHPDLFARAFVGVALHYFEGQGHTVTACIGEWEPFVNSDNFDAFMTEYQQHHNKVRAAQSTWSGKTFMSYGFTRIEADDVIIYNRKGGSNWGDFQSVTATFRKP